MLYLLQLLENTPQTRKINLEFKNLKDMIPIINILNKFKHMTELLLHGNKITHLPPLDSLQHLRHLDITNNPIKIDKILLDRLFQLPHLEDLEINANNEEKQRLIENLPKLKILNGQTIKREVIAEKTVEQELKYLNGRLKQEMKRIKQIYDKLSQALYQGDEKGQKSKLEFNKDQEFSQVYKDVQEEMNYFYSGLKDSLSREGVFAYCKNKLTGVLDNLMIRMLDQLGNENTLKVYEEIIKIKADNFDTVLRIIFSNSYERHLNQQLEKPTNRLRKETLYQNELFRVKKELLEFRKEENKMQFLSSNQELAKMPVQHKLASTMPRMSSRNGNKASARQRSPTNLNKSPSKSGLKQPSQVLNRSPSNTLNRTPSKNFNKTPSKLRLDLKENDRHSGRQRMSARSPQSRSPHNNNSKIVSVQQLSELITEIMAEKRKQNQKHLQKGENFETLQDFLYNFFSRRYGLKEIALQWSLSTIKSIERYCRDSIQVQIFGKILKNQLYQHYYDDYKEFRNQVEQILRKQKISSQVNEFEFRRLFLYFYSFQNKETVDKIVTTMHFPISYQEMSYFLQSYKLAFEQKHLKVFVDSFEAIDSQQLGALSKNQCRQLCKRIIRKKELGQTEGEKLFKFCQTLLQKSSKDHFIFSQAFQLVHKIL